MWDEVAMSAGDLHTGHGFPWEYALQIRQNMPSECRITGPPVAAFWPLQIWYSRSADRAHGVMVLDLDDLATRRAVPADPGLFVGVSFLAARPAH